MNARLEANVLRLCPSILQRVTGVNRIPRTITAPEPIEPVHTMLSEPERLAQFAYSENFHKRGMA